LDGVIGIGRGASVSALQARYCRQAVAIDHNEDGVWIIPPFDPAAAATTSSSTGTSRSDNADTGTAGVGTAGGASATTAAATKAEPKRQSIRRFVIRGAVPAENWSDIFRCFVSPAARMQLAKLQLGIEFEMEVGADKPLDGDDPTLKAMREAARQLGLDFDTGD
jgi:hypothetical protein